MDRLQFVKTHSGDYRVSVNGITVLYVNPSCVNPGMWHIQNWSTCDFFMDNEEVTYYDSEYAAMIRCIEYLRDCAEIGEVL